MTQIVKEKDDIMNTIDELYVIFLNIILSK